MSEAMISYKVPTKTWEDVEEDFTFENTTFKSWHHRSYGSDKMLQKVGVGFHQFPPLAGCVDMEPTLFPHTPEVKVFYEHNCTQKIGHSTHLDSPVTIMAALKIGQCMGLGLRQLASIFVKILKHEMPPAHKDVEDIKDVEDHEIASFSTHLKEAELEPNIVSNSALESLVNTQLSIAAAPSDLTGTAVGTVCQGFNIVSDSSLETLSNLQLTSLTNSEHSAIGGADVSEGGTSKPSVQPLTVSRSSDKSDGEDASSGPELCVMCGEKYAEQKDAVVYCSKASLNN